MTNTFSKQSYKYLSILIVAIIISSLIILFLGNTKVDDINSIDELINNQDINCNQHYWTLKNKIHDLGNYDVSIVHKDIYIFPEIENILCLGKVTDVVLDGNSVYVVSGTNQKVFIYLSSAVFLFFILLLQFLSSDKKLILSLFTLALVFVQLYLFSSFKNPLISFVNLLILVFIAFATLESFKNPKFKHLNFLICLFCILVISIIFLNYIYFDYVIYLSIIGLVFLKTLQKLLNLSNLDIGYLILLSHIGLILGGIDYPLSRNQINYFPSILHNINADYFNSHYLNEMVYPYPIFESITKFIITIFGVTSINFLNYFSYFFSLLVTFIFVKNVIKKNWKNVCLIFSLISGRLAIFSFYKDTGWDQNIYQNSFIKSGIGENQLLTHLFQPTTFDILVLLVIVFLINKNFVTANFISIICIVLHTYNIVPIFLIYISYLLTDKITLNDIILKIKNSFLLIISLPIVFLINILPMSSSKQAFLDADIIMTTTRIPMHRLFSGKASLFGRSNKELLFNLFENDTTKGFHFELEYLVMTVILIFLIKNPLIKNLNILIFSMTFITIFYTYIFHENYISAQIRNIVPWRTSSIVYLFGLIYIINQLIIRFERESLSVFVSFIVLVVIFSLSVSVNINDNRLRGGFEDYGNLYSGQNLINPNDNLVIFGTSNNWSNNSFSFISTTHNYYGHPYKSNEIINWYKAVENVNDFFESNPNCEEFEKFIYDTGSQRALFSSKDYFPLSILTCENLNQEKYLGYYIFENTK